MQTVVKNILMLPVWVVQIFSGTKSFQANPVIGNHILNRLGLHIARVLLSHGMAHLRRLVIAPWVPAEYRRQFNEQGYICINDFLPQDQFERLEAEMRQCLVPLRACHQGDTLTLISILDQDALKDLPECRAVAENSLFNRLMMYSGSHANYPHLFINSIKNGYEQGGEDPQKNCHVDTYHITSKCWLYIDDVSMENGPFHYIPGSHRLTWNRLKWEYEQSIQGKNLEDTYAKKGSLRLYEDSWFAAKLPKPQAFTVPKNSLLMANTFGIHCRGQAQEKSSRLALYASNRANPFNPLPGLPSRSYRRVVDYFLQKSYTDADIAAEKKGMRPSWYHVPSEKLHQ